MSGRLLDERSDPPLRALIGTMLREATSADFAIGHVRLCAIDLSDEELFNVGSCRLLLDRLDVEMLTDAADIAACGGDLAINLERLLTFARSGRLELRSAATPSWSPDFSIFDGLSPTGDAPVGSVCLVGAHYFSRPVMLNGASFTCVLTDTAAIATARLRFNELWNAAHDVLPVIEELLCSCVG